MKSRRKLPKIAAYMIKIVKFFGSNNFWTPVKSNIPDVWNENCWTLFGSEIEVGDNGPSGSPSGYAPVDYKTQSSSKRHLINLRIKVEENTSCSYNSRNIFRNLRATIFQNKNKKSFQNSKVP